MKIYSYSECCVQAGQVVGVDLPEDKISGDYFCSAVGTKEEIIAFARERILKAEAFAAGSFTRKTYSHILKYFYEK